MFDHLGNIFRSASKICTQRVTDPKGGRGELQRTEKNKTVRDNGIGKVNIMEQGTNGA